MKKTNKFLFLFPLFFYFAFTMLLFPSDLILFNGKVITAKGAQVTEAVVIKGKKIVFTGTTEKALKYKKGPTEIFDLKGKTVTPGFHDSDTNFKLGSELFGNKLNLYGLSKKEIIKKLRQYFDSPGKKSIVYGYLFDHLNSKGEKWPSKHDLDKISGSIPIIVYRTGGRSAWVNSKVLKTAGISRFTPDVKGGEIFRFPDRSPTGILMNNALSLLDKLNPEANDPDPETFRKNLLKNVKIANSLGITSVTTSGGSYLIEQLKALQKEKKLTLRFFVSLPAKNIGSYMIKKLAFNSGNDYIRTGFLKITADGSFSSQSAAIFSKYIGKNNYGPLLLNRYELLELTEVLHRNKWQAGIHAEGNRSVFTFLNILEKLYKRYGARGSRHRIENSKLVLGSDLKRISKLSVVLSIRPAECSGEFHLAEKTLGERTASSFSAIASLKDKNIPVIFGSGWPENTMDPIPGLYFALKRKNIKNREPVEEWFAEEKIPLHEAIRSYTFWPAYATYSEKRAGTIEAGKSADIIIFNSDISGSLKGKKPSITDLSVFRTIVGGKTVFKSR
ncbi:MAG: amidohydrolase [Acidobacteriota bacterium]